jgi:hypothetical protein
MPEDFELPPLTPPEKETSEKIYQKYKHMLPPDYPEKHGRDYLVSVYTIMSSFADIAWGQDSVSMALKAQDKAKAAKKAEMQEKINEGLASGASNCTPDEIFEQAQRKARGRKSPQKPTKRSRKS